MIADDLAAAVTEELNASSFSVPFTAEHLEVPEFELSDLATLRVTVIDAQIELTPVSRTRHAHDVSVDVAVQKRLVDDINEPKELKSLVQEIMDHFRNLRLSMVANSSFQRAAYLAHKVPEHLRDKRVFTGVIRLTYRTVR